MSRPAATMKAALVTGLVASAVVAFGASFFVHVHYVVIVLMGSVVLFGVAVGLFSLFFWLRDRFDD